MVGFWYLTVSVILLSLWFFFTLGVSWVVDLYWLYALGSFNFLSVLPLGSVNGIHLQEITGWEKDRSEHLFPAALVSFYWVAFFYGFRVHWFLGIHFLLCPFRPKGGNGFSSLLSPERSLSPVCPLNPAYMSINSFFIEIS